MQPLRVTAPAKLNLFLHVTGKRADGYHLLDSLVGFADFGDVLDITPSDRISLSVKGPYAEALSGENNIILKAAELLKAHAGVGKGAHIALTKRIPVGGGLGGGSSDAAAALRGLMILWQVKPDERTRMDMALKLGSDVPVCMAPRLSWMAGVGEELTPIPTAASGWLVLVNAGMALLTKDVFARYGAAHSQPMKRPAEIASLGELMDFILPQHNALEKPAVELMPVVGHVLTALRSTEGCLLARMSGSGATCFGIYSTSLQASRAVLQLKKYHPTWWVQDCAFYKEEPPAHG